MRFLCCLNERVSLTKMVFYNLETTSKNVSESWYFDSIRTLCYNKRLFQCFKKRFLGCKLNVLKNVFFYLCPEGKIAHLKS